MQDCKRSEAYFHGFQETKLYYQRWTIPNHKGTVLVTHGHGEHSDSYHRLVQTLNQAGWQVLAWDWRGHGRSEGVRGYANHFNEYCNDFEIWVERLLPDLTQNQKPISLFAHSMGGLIQLKVLANHPQWPITAQILCNPLLGVALEIPVFKKWGAEWLGQYLPKVTLSNEVKDEDLTRDPLVLKEYQRDSLRHDRISARVYLGALDTMNLVQDRATRIRFPTLLQLSPQDQVVSPGESRRFFESLKVRKVLREYAQAKHEIYNDLDSEVANADLLKFLEVSQEEHPRVWRGID